MRKISGKLDDDHLHYHGVDSAEKHLSVKEALETFLGEIRTTKSETIGVYEANGRVFFSDLTCPENLPRIARSTRDGYAVKLTADDLGEIENRTFIIIGEVRIGAVSKLIINSGQAAKVATGSFVPRGANAVAMKEYSQVEDGRLKTTKNLKIGENILSPGEDLKKGELLFRAGTRLRPHHIALLSLLGVKKAKLFSRPRIAIFSTGDELQDPFKSKKLDNAATFDSNRPFLSSIISELGALPVDLGIARDNFDETKSKMMTGLKYDALILSAGSSVGDRDYVSRAAESIKGMRMLVHGVAMRPSSPTGLAVYRGKPVVFLPGFPTSAIVSFYVFGRPSILKLSGLSSTEFPTIRARLDEDFDGKPGLTHFLRVKISREGEQFIAKIVRPTEAQYSSWLREANGIAILGADGKTNAVRGDEVSVYLIDQVEENNVQLAQIP